MQSRRLRLCLANPSLGHRERVYARLAVAGCHSWGRFTVPNSIKRIHPLIGQILVESEAHHSTGGSDRTPPFYNALRPDRLCARQSRLHRWMKLATQAG